MSVKTKIEWAERSWNPVRGCSRVSAGCDNCYAISVAHRFSGPGMPYEGLTVIRNGRPDFSGKVMLVEKDLMDPLHRKTPTRYFVNSMSDVFHHNVPDEYVDRMFAVMALAAQHTFLILTKRPKRMREYFLDGASKRVLDQIWVLYSQTPGAEQRAAAEFMDGHNLPDVHFPPYLWPLPNVWLGTSAENQETYNKRIVPLQKTPAAIHFVSCEPLLGPIDLAPWKESMLKTAELASGISFMGTRAKVNVEHLPRLDWVIIGGESGPHARPCNLAWIYSLIAQCKGAGINPFVKQLGSIPVISEQVWRDFSDSGRTLLLAARNASKVSADVVPLAFNDKKGGNMEEWPEDLRVREYPEVTR